MQAAPWQGQVVLVNATPSPWWHWGPAIFLALSVLGTIVGTAIAAIIPYDQFLDEMEKDTEEPGAYPENGTSEEQDEWNATKERWDQYVALTELIEGLEEIKPYQIGSGFLVGIVGIAAVVFLFMRDEKGFKFAYAWIVTSVITQAIMGLTTQDMMTEFYANMPSEEDFLVEWMNIQYGIQLGSLVVCNILLFSIFFMCSMKSQDLGQIEESGFHTQPTSTILDGKSP